MGGTFSGSFVNNGSFNPALSGAGTFSFTYNFTDANGCSASDEGSIEVLPGCALSVGVVSGPTNSCSHQGTTGINATYSVTATDATSYLWTIPSGATNVSGQGTASISFRFSSTFTTGSVSVVVSGCSASETRSITVTRATPATPAAISGPANVCAFRGTSNLATYSNRACRKCPFLHLDSSYKRYLVKRKWRNKYSGFGWKRIYFWKHHSKSKFWMCK
jgi:hypothetical protein